MKISEDLQSGCVWSQEAVRRKSKPTITVRSRRIHLDTPTGARAVPARSTSLGRGGLEHS